MNPPRLPSDLANASTSPPRALVLLALLACASMQFASAASVATSNGVAASVKSQVGAHYGKLPISFEANRGQSDAAVKFLSRGPGYSLFLTPAEAVLRLRGAEQSAVVRLSFAGANGDPSLRGVDPQGNTSNYFVGSTASSWQHDVANFAKVEYADLYPGIDLLYYGNQHQLEYDFIVAPGADPGRIALNVAGVDKMHIDAEGNLVLSTGLGDLVQHRPIVYQQVAGKRQVIDARYAMQSDRRVGFHLGAYDVSLPLVIDPVLVYSSYLGGTLGDRGYDVAVDASSNAYVAGRADSSNFPVKGAYQATNKGASDAFVAKFSGSGALVYSSYFGGVGQDEGFGIAVDSTGSAYVTGRTTSLDFPVTAAAFQRTLGGVQDAFVTKFSAAGNALVYSTYLGGNANSASATATGDFGYSVAVDGSGNAYVTGYAVSTNFPTTAGAFQTAGGGTWDDVFVSKLNAGGSALVYSTYVGGSQVDEGYAIAVDGSGNAYVTGITQSSNFPIVAARQGSNGGNGDAFAFKLNAAGSALAYSTFLGGIGTDAGYGIAVDAAGNSYVAGVSQSANFPLQGSLQLYNGGVASSSGDAFVTKYNAAGSAYLFSTYLGGSVADTATGIALDSSGNAYVSGQTTSTNFPMVGAIQSTSGGASDAFLSKISAAGSSLVYSTYLGGAGDDFGNEIAVDAGGDAYITGQTQSTNFPVAAAAQAANGGNLDAFLARVSTSTEATLSVSDASVIEGNSGIVNATFTVTLSRALSAPVTFSFATANDTATAGSDYFAASLTGQTIAAGSTSKTFTVAINGDTTGEADETFFVNLSAASGAILGDAQGIGTIVNDDVIVAPALSIADMSVAEGNAGTTVATFTVTLSPAATGTVTYNIATADGTATAGSDYVAASATAQTMAAGVTSKTFSVTINGDTTVEPNETFLVNLTGVTGAAVADGQAVGTINNDDAAPLPALSVNDVTVTEGNSGTSLATFTVSLSAASASAVSFDVFTSNNTAASGSDYAGLNLPAQSIPAGSTSKIFSVTINGDTTLEANETFFFNVSSVVGATVADSQGLGTINNDDVAALPALSINDVTVNEGNSGTSIATFTVSLSAVPAGTVSFDIATANGTATAGSDFIALALTGQSIAAGVTSKNFSVIINGDTTSEPNETFTLNASNVSGATVADGSGLGTINNDDGGALPTLTVANASVTEGNAGSKTLSFVVSLSAPAATPVVFYANTSDGTASAGSDYTSLVNVAQTITAGQTSATVNVSVTPDILVEADETLFLNIGNLSGATGTDRIQAIGTLVNDDSALLTITQNPRVEGNSGTTSAVFTIDLSTPLTTPVTFDIATSNGTALSGEDYQPKSLNMSIPAGRTRVTLEVLINGDTTPEADETFKVTISNPVGAALSSSLVTDTILNDDTVALTIGTIQGSSQLSLMDGKPVVVEGIVTAVAEQGFFLQSADAETDGKPDTSDGIYVASAPSTSAVVGNRLSVSGLVQEKLIGGSADQLTQTQIRADKLTVLSTGNALPAAIVLDARNAGADQPVTGLERFEGMRVSLPQLRVVAAAGGRIDDRSGQARSNGLFYAVAKGVARPFREPGLSVLDRAPAVAGVSPTLFDANPERLLINSVGLRGARALSADVGDTISGMAGVLGYGNGAYQVLPDPGAKLSVVSAAAPKAVTAARVGRATIATFNLRRFGDDNVAGSAPVLGASAYATRLAKTANAICSYAKTPDILGLAEVENKAALSDLAAAVNGNDGNLLFPGSCAGNPGYQAYLLGNDGKGRNLGFLVSTATVGAGVPRVEVLSVTQAGAAARFSHADGSSELLTTRPTLVLQARINDASGHSLPVTVIANQLTGLEGNLAAAGPHGWATLGDYLQAKRAAQAGYLAGLIQARQNANPAEKLVVLGDFNASEFSDGHADLLGLVSGRPTTQGKVISYLASPVRQPLTNLTTRLPKAERYTVTRDGNAQAVDHILVNAALLGASPNAHVEIARINADFAEDNLGDAGVPMRVSDHDPVVGYFDLR